MGGVVEHPAYSTPWRALALPEPGEFADAFGGFTVRVDQCNWGHFARKATWLYVVGVPRALVMSGVRTGGRVTHWIAGARKRRVGGGGLIPPGIKVCSAQQRRRTPPAFARWLVDLAAAARRDQSDLAMRAG
jgi:hypothetical protein